MLHHTPRKATPSGAGRGHVCTAGASRLVVLDIRGASLAARLAASVKLAQQEKEAK